MCALKLCYLESATLPTTTPPGSCLFQTSVSAFTNAKSSCIRDRIITYHGGCTITVNVSSHERQPGKAVRKLIYILSNEKRT